MAQPQGDPRFRMTQPRILIAEDEPDIRDSLATLLAIELPGADVDTVATAERALERIHEQRAQREPFDVVITDHQMSRMTGLDLLAKLVEEGDPAVRVLMSAGDEIQTIARDDPAIHAFLPKPFDPAELARAVSAALARLRPA